MHVLLFYLASSQLSINELYKAYKQLLHENEACCLVITINLAFMCVQLKLNSAENLVHMKISLISVLHNLS